jgi:hypothetical protein
MIGERSRGRGWWWGRAILAVGASVMSVTPAGAAALPADEPRAEGVAEVVQSVCLEGLGDLGAEGVDAATRIGWREAAISVIQALKSALEAKLAAEIVLGQPHRAEDLERHREFSERLAELETPGSLPKWLSDVEWVKAYVGDTGIAGVQCAPEVLAAAGRAKAAADAAADAAAGSAPVAQAREVADEAAGRARAAADAAAAEAAARAKAAADAAAAQAKAAADAAAAEAAARAKEAAESLLNRLRENAPASR